MIRYQTILLIALLIVGCDKKEEGCTDSNAINFNPNATVADNTCEYSVYGWWGMGNGGSGEILSSGEYYFTSSAVFYHRNSTKAQIMINHGHNSGYIKLSFAVTAQFPN